MSPLRAFVVAAGLLPVAGLLTLLLVPLWRVLEARTGLEAIGHGGPASWCYGAVYLALLATIGVVLAARRRPRTSRRVVRRGAA